MPGFSLAPLPLALWLASGAGTNLPAELPSGSSPIFKARMMRWSAPEPPPLPSAPPVRRKPGGAALPRLSSGFGYRSDPIRGAAAMHSGVDIPGPLGTPVQASAAGVVRFAGTAGGYGRMIEIDHGGGLRTRYAHLARLLVGAGTPVAQGETIALMGSTGRSTGSHLHFEVRMQGRAVDPLGYLGTPPQPDAAAVQAVQEAVPHVSAFARARETARRSEAPAP